jgi:Uma2 family endonuclease
MRRFAKFVSEGKHHFTYADYQSWSEDERVEIIDGILYYTHGGEIMELEPMMQATPTFHHQGISINLILQVGGYLKGKSCRLFAAPCTVRLNAEAQDDVVLEPDLLVICDSTRINGSVCNGAPDVVMEILSPSTAKKDRTVKFQAYQKAGVREYWVVDPDNKSVEAHVLKNGRYFSTDYIETADAPITALPGLIIHLSDVFAELPL